ncbi:MAG: PAS domain S-box protein, partial [Luteitalea sp.]|nr:PAS domain S-box protein [Luteitalea sp.]
MKDQTDTLAPNPERQPDEQAADTQAAILNALPAHVALIDPDGVILSVNESWRRFAAANLLLGSGLGVGQNYLAISERASDACSEETRAAAAGIRGVLQGETRKFDLEYSCHSATEQRWFQLAVVPVHAGRRTSAVVIHIPITERKQAEERSRLLAGQLTTTLESLTDGFFTVDRDWRFTYVNREAERMFKRPRTELLGRQIWQIFPEARDSIARQEYERALGSGVAVQFEMFFPPFNAWFDARAFPSPQGLAVHFRDITAVRMAGEALRVNEERSRLLAKATNDAVWDWDLDTNALWWNEGFSTLFGYGPEEVDPTVKSWTDHIHPDDRARVTDSIHRAIEHGAEGWTGEYRFRRQDGSYAYVLDRGHVIRDGAGKPIRMIGGMTDQTERHRAEETLRRQQTELRVLFDLVPAMIWFKDTKNGILRVNKLVAETAGLSISDIEGKTSHEVYPEEAAGFYADDLEVIRSGTAKLGIIETVRDRAGKELWVQTDKVPYHDQHGKVIGIVVMAQDITERKLAEQRLRASTEEISRANRALQEEIVERKRSEDAAEAANRSKSKFLANMSHEIRTPLNGVIGMTELALATELTSEQREYLETVKSSSESLLTVINDILDFSKIEARQLSIDLIPFDLSDCLSTTVKTLATQVHLKGLEMVCDIRPDVPTALVGDPSRLRQIITNLVGNAIKFTERGEVVVTIEVETQTDRDAILRFSVSDTGIGVPPGRQEAIFKPFVQADLSTTRKFGGTGLGLAISRNLVALLGGRIWLESETDKGSTFHFTVSFDLQQAPPPTTARSEQMRRL